MKDETITCIQCNNPFIFSALEQRRFWAQGYDGPKRCPDCRKNKTKVSRMDEELKRKKKQKHAWQRIRHGVPIK